MRQYAFVPKAMDPRIEAESQWDELRDELNVCRDALESSNAENTTLAAMVDMLRKELDRAKIDLVVVERSNAAMRGKLHAAGLVVLDALKADEIERGVAVSEYAVRSPVKAAQVEPQEERPAFLHPVRPPQNKFG